MSTIAEAPPEPSHDELEALIEEARRRARRRRLLIGGAIATGLLLAGLVSGLVLAFRGDTGTAVPKGFHLVQARGSVRHVLLETVTPLLGQTMDLATGREHPARETDEIWWDRRSGLVRTVVRYDGRVARDFVEQRCEGSGKKRRCVPPEPFDVGQRGLGWPPKANVGQVAGTTTFRGHHVVLVEGLVQPGQGKRPYGSGSQVAYDVVTHRPLALREFVGGRMRPPGVHTKPTIWLRAVRSLPNVDPRHVSFVVPDGGADFNPPGLDAQVRTPGLDAAREAVGTTPLWLGRSFQGHKLMSVLSGDEAERYESGRRLRPAGFALFAYRGLSVQEFHEPRSLGFEGPAAGTALLDGRATLYRSGFLIVVQAAGPNLRADGSFALAVVKALRPVDASAQAAVAPRTGR
jgi:hypothetical protein